MAQSAMVGIDRIVIFLLTFLMVPGSGIRFSIDAQVDQIFRIIEKTHTAIETSDMKMVMTPADFNFIVPFTVRMTCSDGLMVVHDMRRIHQEDIYMDAVNENETYISVRFTVSEMDFKYDLCWLSLIIPVPLWLKGKILQSTYYVTSKISYKPNCEFTITKSSLESYEKMTLNIFNWLPGGLGDAMTEMLTRNTQDRIYDTVSKSIEKTLTKLSTVYDACVAFPPMGRLTELPQTEDELDEEQEEYDDLLLAVVQRDEVTEDGLNSEKEANEGPAVQANKNEQEQARDEIQGTQHDQMVSTCSGSSSTELNEGDHETCVVKIRTGQQNGHHEDRGGDNHANRKAGGRAKSKPKAQKPKTTKAPPTEGFYEIVRSKVIARDLEKSARSIEGKKDVEYKSGLHDDRIMISMDKPLLGDSKNNEPKAGVTEGEEVSNTIGRQRIRKNVNGKNGDHRKRMLDHLGLVETGGQCNANTKPGNNNDRNIKKEAGVAKSGLMEEDFEVLRQGKNLRHRRSRQDSTDEIGTEVNVGVDEKKPTRNVREQNDKLKPVNYL